MSYLQKDHLSCKSSPFSEDYLIKKLLLSHDLDGSRFDSELLLHAVETIMLFATKSEHVWDINFDADENNEINYIEEISTRETFGDTIGMILHEIVCISHKQGNLHERTMALFDLLGNYNWDSKAVLVIAAFATSYGKLLLLMEMNPSNPLAVLVAKLKKLPADISKLKSSFKTLRLLMKTVVDVTKCVIKFEGLPFSHSEVDDEAKTNTKFHIYVAVYWIVRSILTCFSHLSNPTPVKPEQVCSDSTVIEIWELSSLLNRLSKIYVSLSQQVETCHQQAETKLYQKLFDVFKKSQVENQQVLKMLFALGDDLPLIDCSSQAKLGVAELDNKVAILLISKPELFSIEQSHLLVQQAHSHPHNKKLEGSYKIIWVPIPLSSSWTDTEKRNFRILSHYLPWYSIRRPWSLNSAVIKFIHQEWKYKGDSIMVVLDSQGNITNLNAIDMVLIWGYRAYPFSASRETELWHEENWTLQLLVDEISPLITNWVQEGKYICIYGSSNINWTLDFNDKMKDIKKAGIQVEMVYVGMRKVSQHVRNILATIEQQQNLFNPLSLTKIPFFWLRLESIRRSKLRQGARIDTDSVLKEVTSLLDMDENGEGWAVIGRGTSMDNVVRLEGNKLMECLNKFSECGKNVWKLGFLGALKTVIEPPLVVEPCGDHFNVISYDEEPKEEMLLCHKCRHPMNKFVIYK